MSADRRPEPQAPTDDRATDDAAMVAALDARAADDIAAGRLLVHDAVLDWLRDWGCAVVDRPLP